VLFSEPTTALNSQSDLKTLFDVVATMIICMAEHEYRFSGMDDIFTPTRNVTLLYCLPPTIS